jgi:hypothetical protein
VFNYSGLKAFRRIDGYRWIDRDVMLYALSLGLGRDPLNESELPFVYEGQGLRTLPTFPALTLRCEFLEEFGINFAHVLHAAERLTLHRPLPTSAAVEVETLVREVFDKGENTGALLWIESRAVYAESREPAFTVSNYSLARADGGFGGPRGGPEPHRVPERCADLTMTIETRPDQALLYRLNGDRNALHADPAAAREAGFHRPVLDGPTCGCRGPREGSRPGGSPRLGRPAVSRRSAAG